MVLPLLVSASFAAAVTTSYAGATAGLPPTHTAGSAGAGAGGRGVAHVPVPKAGPWPRAG